jgi:hypothetical protein
MFHIQQVLHANRRYAVPGIEITSAGFARAYNSAFIFFLEVNLTTILVTSTVFVCYCNKAQKG